MNEKPADWISWLFLICRKRDLYWFLVYYTFDFVECFCCVNILNYCK